MGKQSTKRAERYLLALQRILIFSTLSVKIEYIKQKNKIWSSLLHLTVLNCTIYLKLKKKYYNCYQQADWIHKMTTISLKMVMGEKVVILFCEFARLATAWWAENYSKIKVAQYPFKIHSYYAQVVSGWALELNLS